MPSYVLGLSAFFHDSAACLLCDGEIVLAVEEERLSRVKHDHGYPARAVEAVLATGGIRPGDVDAVVFYEKTLPKLERQLHTWLDAYPRSFTAFVRGMSRWLDGRVNLGRWLERKGFRGRILFSEHHLSHAAFAFYTSPFERAHVLIADGVGEWATTSLWSAGPDALVPSEEIHFPDSLGLFYSLVTAHLGFRVNDDEYKVMGLAAYGSDRYSREMDALLQPATGGAFVLSPRYLHLAGRDTLASPELERLLGPRRAPGAAIEDRHRDLAASAQRRLERALLDIVRRLPDDGLPLCYGGGVALNGVANAVLSRERPLHIPFAPGDSGSAIGAALVGHHLASGAPRSSRGARATPFLGPRIDTRACEALARSRGLVVERLDGTDARVAQSLAAGNIIGWVDGAMEFGPRALGHRSLLADPRRAEMRDRLNMLVKRREPFRPFAPIVPEERAPELFDVDHPVPWMTEVHPVRVERRAELAAVVHIDGTARLQTVNRAELPRLHALLLSFEALAGVPVLLNTSFNVAGEPIVCTGQDALDTAQSAGLDAVVLEDLWIEFGSHR